jgi:hypothetical protein
MDARHRDFPRVILILRALLTRLPLFDAGDYAQKNAHKGGQVCTTAHAQKTNTADQALPTIQPSIIVIRKIESRKSG